MSDVTPDNIRKKLFDPQLVSMEFVARSAWAKCHNCQLHTCLIRANLTKSHE